MKIALAGKGGVGKTLMAASLARIYSRKGVKVLAIDADPAMNLGYAIGFPEEKLSEIKPLSDNERLIKERVNVFQTPGNPILNLKPKVDDLVDSFSLLGPDGVRLLVLGTVKTGGEGCLCPANTLLKALMRHVLFKEGGCVFMDTEAGLEHLGRGTAKGFDLILVLVEPGNQSLETAWRIGDLAQDIGIKKVEYVANKVSSREEITYINRSFREKGLQVKTFIPFDSKVKEADMRRASLIDYAPTSPALKSIEEFSLKL